MIALGCNQTVLTFTPPAGQTPACGLAAQWRERQAPTFFGAHRVQSKFASHVPSPPPFALADAILNECLDRSTWDAGALRRLVEAAGQPDSAVEATRALFQVVVEGLAARFEPRLSEVYARLFSQVIAQVDPAFDASAGAARYLRLRGTRRFRLGSGPVRRVYVLSRVTLGADIAVTSVLLDAAKRRFPQATVLLVGPEKNHALFAADPRIEWLPAPYGRTGTLSERLAVAEGLRRELSAEDGIVIDPDSRLTQLGLIPVCPDESYYFFDSRSYGGLGREPLTVLAQRWAGEVFDIRGAAPYVAPATAGGMDQPAIVVNLGVGENPAKRVTEPFEAGLLGTLANSGLPVVVDLGAGGEEERRVRRAVATSGAPADRIRLWRGPFAELAGMISRARLYVGYDSAGQHAAAVCGTPLVTVFAGFPCERMLERWTPSGPGPKEVVRVDDDGPLEVLRRTRDAIDRLVMR